MTLEGYPKMEENPKIFMIESCWVVKVINTVTGGEALILSMYTNYFDGPVSIEESVLHFEKASKFHGYNFQIENSTDVVLSGWILLSINEHGCTLIIPQKCHMYCYLKVICALNFLFPISKTS